MPGPVANAKNVCVANSWLFGVARRWNKVGTHTSLMPGKEEEKLGC